MTDYILHHFDASPFAEKIRLVFGLKRLAWRSVQIPMIMPKPDLVALTGGYRKTPVLQIGADIYCDTIHIAHLIESLEPTPTLYPNGRSGLARALGRWSDTAFFEPGAALSMGENPQVPQAVIDDRKAFFNFMDFDNLDADLPHCRTQFQAQAQLVEDELSTDSAYIEGDNPGLADIHAWFPVWMAMANIPTAQKLLSPFPKLQIWSDRMSKIDHGSPSDMTSNEALTIAKEATPTDCTLFDADNPLGLYHGQMVNVAADDYGCDPVHGELAGLTLSTATIRRQDPVAGELNVHFPRAGFRVTAA
ncbi:MAG: glutathione S-transferase family protein [Gammaproteobacteria bacterium]